MNTNWRSCCIFKTKQTDQCRRCGEHPETGSHIISGCPKLAQTVYLERHNAVASTIHWSLTKELNFERAEHWWEHKPEPVLENDAYKLLYDFNIMTDKKITARRPDIVIVNKGQRKTTLIDIACPCDRNVNDKETEKVEKYQDLKIELQRLWNTSVEIVPIVVGALGAISRTLQKYLQKLNVTDIRASQIQKTVLLKTVNILRRHHGV